MIHLWRNVALISIRVTALTLPTASRAQHLHPNYLPRYNLGIKKCFSGSSTTNVMAKSDSSRDALSHALQVVSQVLRLDRSSLGAPNHRAIRGAERRATARRPHHPVDAEIWTRQQSRRWW